MATAENKQAAANPFAHAMGIAAANASDAQQQLSVIAQAATNMSVTTLYSIDSTSLGIATKKLLGK